jgi:hypothetical protein
MNILRNLSLAASALTLAVSLSACGGANSVPPMTMYPGQFPPQQFQQPMLNGNMGNNPLSNDALPNDVTQGQVGSVVGRVVNRSGRTLHNVQVWLESNPQIKTTSQRGDFTLMNVPAGQHNLVLKFGNLETTTQVNVMPNMAVAPAQNPVLLDGEVGSDALAFANPNRQIAAFKVDQGYMNRWQPTGVVVDGGNLYVSAIDVSSLVRKGTVIKMNAQTGEEWKNLASTWLGLRHPLNSTTRGLAMTNAGLLLVTDKTKDVFSVDPNSGAVTRTDADSAIDVASGNGVVWFSSVRGLEKSDSSGSSRSLISGVAASGGIGADKEGNAYVPVRNSIQKVTPDGNVTPLITQYLNSPLDVAIDPRNGDIYILDSGEIKRFDKDGQFIVNFSSAALTPSSIDLDDSGALYVADFGGDHRSAQIIKFDAVPLVDPVASTAPVTAAESGFDGGLLPADQNFDSEAEAPSYDELPELDGFGADW